MAQIPLSGSVGAGGSFPILGNALAHIVGDADITLNAAQYTNQYIRVTSDGASSGVRKVIAPLFQGLTFIVSNETTEGHAITFTGATGTGVLVQPGTSVQVVTDGSNYIQTISTVDILANVSVLIFRPGGVAGGNVYVDEAALSAAAISPQRKIVIEFDLSLVGGTYTLVTVGDWDTGTNTEWTDLGYGYALNFSNGTTLPNLPTHFSGYLELNFTQTETIAEVTHILSVTFSEGVFLLGNPGSGTFIDVNSGGFNRVNIFFTEFAVALGDPGAASPLFTVSSGQLSLNMLDSSTMANATAAGPGVVVAACSPGVEVSADLYPQVQIFGLFIDANGGGVSTIPVPQFIAAQLFDATTGFAWYSNGSTWLPASSQYTAADATKWAGSPPTTVQSALDRIAANTSNAHPIP
jgi:hypothetical protein